MKITEVSESIIGRRVSCIENGARVTGVITGISEDEYTVYVHIKFDEPLLCWDMDSCNESWTETEYKSWARKWDGWGNLQNTYFIDTLDWLADYKPKDHHFTDEFEMRDIANNLGLKKMGKKELQDIRNNVVLFYDKLIEKAIMAGDHVKRWDLSDGLMSVTAVIDHYKWQAGAEI